MTAEVGNKWWVFVVRGVLAVLLGVLCFATPGMSLIFLVSLIAAFWLLDGFTALLATERAARTGRPWGWLTFEGIIGILAAIGTWLYPQVTLLVLLMFVAAWAIITGIFKIVTAVRLRRTIENEWLLGTSGILSVLFGIMIMGRPGAGLLAIVWMIGVYALIFGGLLIGLGFRLHSATGTRIDRAVPVH